MSKSAFTGFKMTQPDAAGKLDQQLFEAPKPRTLRDPKVSLPPDTAPASGQQPSIGTTPSKPTPAPLTPAPSLVLPGSLFMTFHLSSRPSYKRSYVFTQEEDEALEDLKIELGRQLDVKLSKEVLVRAALHLLIEDYRKKGEQSYACQVVRSSSHA